MQEKNQKLLTCWPDVKKDCILRGVVEVGQGAKDQKTSDGGAQEPLCPEFKERVALVGLGDPVSDKVGRPGDQHGRQERLFMQKDLFVAERNSGSQLRSVIATRRVLYHGEEHRTVTGTQPADKLTWYPAQLSAGISLMTSQRVHPCHMSPSTVKIFPAIEPTKAAMMTEFMYNCSSGLTSWLNSPRGASSSVCVASPAPESSAEIRSRREVVLLWGAILTSVCEEAKGRREAAPGWRRKTHGAGLGLPAAQGPFITGWRIAPNACVGERTDCIISEACLKIQGVFPTFRYATSNHGAWSNCGCEEQFFRARIKHEPFLN